MEEEKVLQRLHERRLLATAHKPPFPTNKKEEKNTNVRFTPLRERSREKQMMLNYCSTIPFEPPPLWPEVKKDVIIL